MWGHNMNRAKASALLPICAATVTVACPMLGAVPAQAADDQGGAVLSEINAAREANGCAPVAASPQLTAAAARQANDMLDNGVVSHTGSDGSSPVQRISDAGYAPYASMGEIIFWGTNVGAVPAVAVDWWMNSPAHRAIITDCAMTEAGFSAISSGDRVTAAGDFGTR
jgi:uncharacterized protein YkwD